jgi:hypothetical protein
MKRALALSLGFVLLAACQLEFIGPESPARLAVTVEFTDATATLITIDATLAPGITANGNVRSIPDDTLRILGSALVPVEIGDNQVRMYHQILAIDPRNLADPTVAVTPPAVDGTTGAPGPLSLALVWRQGPETVPSDLNTDATLAIANVASLAPASGRGWRLEVSRPLGAESRVISRLSAFGIPPDTVAVPASVFMANPAPQLDAQLEAQYAVETETAAEDYLAELVIEADLRWILDFTIPGPAQDTSTAGGK